MELIELFITFMKVGFMSMGGTTMVPIINAEMVAHNWMTVDEVADIVAIAEMTPGPLGLNCATFAGMRVSGVLGGIIASLGAMMPTFTLCFIVSLFLSRFQKSSVMQNILYAVRPVAMALILATVYSLSKTVFIFNGAFSFLSLIIVAVAAILLWVLKWSVPKVIGVSAILGIILFSV